MTRYIVLSHRCCFCFDHLLSPLGTAVCCSLLAGNRQKRVLHYNSLHLPNRFALCWPDRAIKSNELFFKIGCFYQHLCSAFYYCQSNPYTFLPSVENRTLLKHYRCVAVCTPHTVVSVFHL